MRYKTITADPPWKVELGSTWKTRFTDKARPDRFYETMTVDDLCHLEVPSEKKSHLYLWVVNQHIDWGYEVAEAWGFKVWQMITWCKPGLGVGQFQCNTEHFLVCRKGQRQGNPFGKTKGTYFNWPRGKHSEKPDEFYDLIERISPSPRLEMFSRKKRVDWDIWGDEVESNSRVFKNMKVDAYV